MSEDIHTQIFSCKTREEKKNLLRELSQTAKAIIELNATGENVNTTLIKMYTNEEHQKFNTFKGWIEKGYKVKKGQKGFFIWSKKRTAKDTKAESEEDKEFKFFGMAYIFSNSQVEPIKK